MSHGFPALDRDLASHWSLDPGVAFLNHGSFGACPVPILDRQEALRRELERGPVRFLGREVEARLDHVRDVLGRFLGAHPDDLALVPNATTGVNTVLRSIDLQPGDEILLTSHEYNASRNAALVAAEAAGARLVTVDVPFPIAGEEEVIARVLAGVSGRTKLLLIDHITSATGLILPVPGLVSRMSERGIDTLVDGAHAPGMIPLDLDRLGAAYYTGNCHKWLCTPKGSAFLHVRRDRQEGIRPLVISHGLNARREDRSMFRRLFDWTGTMDPTALLCIPDAIAFLESLLGSFDALREHNHRTVLAGRDLLCEALGIAPPAPDAMLGSLATVPLAVVPARAPAPPLHLHPLQVSLYEEHRIEVPIMPWPEPPHWLLRISAQIYNPPAHYQALARALKGTDG